ncbi:MFS transporter [Anaerosacchariphilus polymeriproducens]|uniref:MFS transporter n=1 Tax=Anaerosacchariphilus polymeriproducens TaxID=1812858 RepID=A0A371AVX9_9FIRM|nr:MFS transporter [Anaerosacchariphilus polymeriproducens]RDU23630.1 MFS transporter [Anaerosacchariphilus polymeriproducens]
MKKFIAIWIGELISNIGSGMTAFAISIYVYQLTRSATWVSVVALLAFAPTILLNPFGGILADRYDRRLLMICGDFFSAVGLLVIIICMQSGYTGVIPICIGVTISSIFLGLLEPAYKATITELLPKEEFAKASGLVQLAGASKYLVSPLIAGLLLSSIGIKGILIIDILTFFVTVFVLVIVRRNVNNIKLKQSDFNFFREFQEGIRSITADKGISSLVLLMTFTCFFLAFMQTLLAPMILAFSNSKVLGIMESVSAVGMLIGSVIIASLNIKRNYSKILIFSLMAAGIFMALAGTTTHIGLLAAFCILFFAALPFVNTCADVLIRVRVSNEMQGRVWGIISVITQAGYVAAYAVCGVLADYVFEPMLTKEGILAGNIGRIIGIGEGRGIGFMLIITGIIMFAFAVIFGSRKSIKEMENELANN